MSIDWQIASVILTGIASLGSLGSLVVFLKYRADNRKTLAETEKLKQESKDMEFERLIQVLNITTEALERCQSDLARKESPPEEKRRGRKGF